MLQLSLIVLILIAVWTLLNTTAVMSGQSKNSSTFITRNGKYCKNKRGFLELSHSKGLKRICDYKTSYAWRYAESPPDYRALDSLKVFDADLHRVISEEWQRKHGGPEGLAEALSGYDRYYSNFNKFTLEQRERLVGAKDLVAKFLASSGVRTEVRSVRRYRPDRNSSSGLPHLKGRHDILDTIHDEAARLSSFIRKTPGAKFESYLVPPVIPMIKSIPALISKGVKTRGIWCYPAVITAIESMFGSALYRGLIGTVHQSRVPIMQGVGSFNLARGFINSIAMDEGLLTLDFLKGDQQMPPWLIKMAKECLEGLVDFSMYEGRRCSEDEALANKRLWDYVFWYFINTPIVFKDVLYRKTGGVPSGSLFTLLIWNVISMIIRCYIKHDVEGRWPASRDLRVCGDDGVMRIHKSGLVVDDFVRSAAQIQIIFHGKPKSDLEYWPHHLKLKTLSTEFGDPVAIIRDETEIFARCCYPSRWITCREESVARILMLSMSVGNSMPRIYEFAKWYFACKPAWLKRPLFVDPDIHKYFRYVLNLRGFKFGGITTLKDLLPVFNDVVKQLMLLINM